MPFPLRLTPFEEYMLVDNSPAYPMCCFIKIKLQGHLNTATFETALAQALEVHPLLAGSVQEQNGQFFWRKAGRMPPIYRMPLDANRQFPRSTGINLFNEPALKVTICNADTDLSAVELEGQTEIIFEIHHSACDALGLLRFIEDTLCNYALIKENREQLQKADNVAMLCSRLASRPRFSFLGQCWSLRRAWKFLINRVSPLTDNKPADMQKLSADYPAILFRELTEAQTQQASQRAKELGITLNELFICSAFLAMREGRPPSASLRIAVPINLRTQADAMMPAANIVRMVFLDRKVKNIKPEQKFYDGVNREMSLIKRYHLGWAFIRGLTVYRRVFGSFHKMMKPDRCWTTATVSNLGKVFADIPLPRNEGYVLVSQSLELRGVEASPPVRASTALGICMMTYAGQLTVNLHYDAAVLTQDEGIRLLDSVVSGIG